MSKCTRDSSRRLFDKRMWSARVLAKYWALQLPATALLIAVLYLLQHRLGIATWLLWCVVGLWTVKDACLYPFLWRAYDPDPVDAAFSLDGARGIATERLDPSGYVHVRGELWRAELMQGVSPVDRGTRVRVQKMRGLTLVVEPLD
jgi:membrane protein implicated in regulation of membrane protease activity